MQLSFTMYLVEVFRHHHICKLPQLEEFATKVLNNTRLVHYSPDHTGEI